MLSLLRAVKLPLFSSIMDPCAGSGGIVRVLRERGLCVFANDLNPTLSWDACEDAMHPGFYKRHAADYIVCSPWFTMLDVFLPLFVAAAKVACFIHVPGHYYTSPTSARMQYFAALARQRSLCVLTGVPVGPVGRRCVWLCVFKSASACESHLMPDGWVRHEAGVLLGV